MDPEIRDALDALEQRLVQKIAGTVAASAADLERKIEESATDLQRQINASAAETRRYMNVLAEGLRSDFRVATELLGPLSQRVAGLEAARDLSTQRVDVLDARVSALERIERTRKPRRR